MGQSKGRKAGTAGGVEGQVGTDAGTGEGAERRTPRRKVRQPPPARQDGDPEFRRYQFDFTPRVTEALDRARLRMDAASYTEVVRRVILAMDQLFGSVKEGDEVLIRRKDGTETSILMP